jgi:glycerophosphoryl diester phosphodiesterase
MSFKHKQILILSLIIIVLFQCKQIKREKSINNEMRITKLLENFKNSVGKDVIVVAHRGDWRNAPENSLQAIENCIKMGVDMVELDVQKTKDNHLIIIHDKRLDRTTTGKGLVSDWTLDSLKTLSLKNGLGNPEKLHKIPTLEEALLTAKGKILVNLDKCYEYFDDALKIIQKTGTSHQVLIKGFYKTVDEVQKDLGTSIDSILFMPVLNLDRQIYPDKIIKDFQSHIKPAAVELIFSKDTSNVINQLSQIKKNGSRVWVNSLWASLNAGYEDELAVSQTDSIYGWYIKKGINIIQTDRPQLLLNYLRSKGLHE